MVLLRTGHTFVSGETVNASDLEEIVTNCTVTAIDRSSIDASQGHLLSFPGNDTPPPGHKTREPWIPSFTRWPVTKLADGTPKSAIPYGLTYTSSESDTLQGGELLEIVSYDGATLTCKRHTTAAPWKCIGVNAFDVSAGNRGVIAYRGVIRIRTHGTIFPGCAWQPSESQAGRATTLDIAPDCAGPLIMGVMIQSSGTIDGDLGVWCTLWR